MSKINATELEKMIVKARIGMKNAYAPRSNFPIGAAVLTSKGNIHQGCNVESVISGMGICAERCAIDSAVANGEYCFRAIAIVSKLEDPVNPCGMCLHYIAEFSQVSGKDIEIIMVGSKGKIKKSTVNKMLPGAFGPGDAGLGLEKYRRGC